MTYSTEQRNILLTYLQTNPDTVFSAKQIAQSLADKNISRSAVYRNLAQLESEQKIKRVVKNGSHEAYYQFYDITACRNHIHLSCTKCGKIFHMEGNDADRLSQMLNGNEGFELNKSETVIYGLCKECK
ncbi:MAG: transcriptional repressor [Treponema sp.]|nr:transcriptional repressor [Treponema sp.]